MKHLKHTGLFPTQSEIELLPILERYFIPTDSEPNIPDQVEPDRDKIFREELDKKWVNIESQGVLKFFGWLKVELLKSEGK